MVLLLKSKALLVTWTLSEFGMHLHVNNSPSPMPSALPMKIGISAWNLQFYGS